MYLSWLVESLGTINIITSGHHHLTRLFYSENENESWYYSTQEQFYQVVSMLDPEKYEMVLCEVKIKFFFSIMVALKIGILAFNIMNQKVSIALAIFTLDVGNGFVFMLKLVVFLTKKIINIWIWIRKQHETKTFLAVYTSLSSLLYKLPLFSGFERHSRWISKIFSNHTKPDRRSTTRWWNQILLGRSNRFVDNSADCQDRIHRRNCPSPPPD